GYEDQLRYLFIVSQVDVVEFDAPPKFVITTPSGLAFATTVSRAEGEKCERCWNYSTRVGESERYPTACERCVEALAEIEREGGAA
ncbi:MAG TPA: zinc finger domain-containing protein, partial [Pyrinomonadaceae bacterium]|nr:zinc finger domain-containing protein [Pyrinomonadaceae bacterium]